MTLVSVVLVLALAGVALVLALIVLRTWRSARDRRLRDVAERLRPAAIELVDTPDAEPPALTGTEARVFAELLAHYSRMLRGDDDERIGAYFEASGAVDQLRLRLRSRRLRRRVGAAFGLGDMASERAIPDLLLALDDPSVDVRAAATRSLGRLGATAAVEPLIGASVAQRVPRSVTGAALLEIGPAAVPHLLDLLDHPDAHFRVHAADLVGLLGSADAADVLLPRLRDASSEVRAAGAAAMGRLGASAGRDQLIDLLADRVPFVRAAAARALGQIGGRSAAAALLEVARHDEFDPAAEAGRALARIDPELVLSCAEDPDAGPHLREAADRLAL
ncbi:HEAT repeat domain-containing protein [Cellulomonas humilata]|uniref:HEAT repeat protein n=1 Tax=Cellulomonas humilata TaxID=144055 RepID=A0ABU0EFC0_9CELL|nr:HEAT repeat domain-containing protein [Cellulomonas humilata]MDQ0373963.1 HEAT repeat protein [Cellulomonas humilata]